VVGEGEGLEGVIGEGEGVEGEGVEGVVGWGGREVGWSACGGTRTV